MQIQVASTYLDYAVITPLNNVPDRGDLNPALQ